MQEWLDLQRKLQVENFGVDPTALLEDDVDPEFRADWVRWNVLAALDELHEVLNTTGWKTWSKKRHFHRKEYVEEMADVMHFVGNLLLTANVTGEELEEAYKAKHDENIRRQKDGY